MQYYLIVRYLKMFIFGRPFKTALKLSFEPDLPLLTEMKTSNSSYSAIVSVRK